MSNPLYGNSVFADIGNLIEELNASRQKSAANQAGGSGSASADPGGHRGKSTHPSAKTDSHTQAAPTGSRAEENARDVEKDIPANVQTSGGVGRDSNYNQIQVGTRKTPVGEDPSTEDAYKGTKEDPGTTSPADASEVGEKYSSSSFIETYKVACALTQNVLARIANDESFESTKQAGEYTGSAGFDSEADISAEAGYELAKVAQALGQDTIDEGVVKFAAARDVTALFYKEACVEADLVGEFLYKTAAYENALAKKAEDPAAAGLPPEAMGGEGQLPPEMGGGQLPPEAGGMGAGGMPPGGPGGGEPDGDEAAVNELANALIDAGVPPEQLLEALHAVLQGGGEHGGAPDGGAGEQAMMAGDGEKTSSANRPSREDLVTVFHGTKRAAEKMYEGSFRRVRPNSKQALDERNNTVAYLNYLREFLRV